MLGGVEIQVHPLRSLVGVTPPREPRQRHRGDQTLKMIKIHSVARALDQRTGLVALVPRAPATTRSPMRG
jgi:hypothetical protein